MTEPRYCEWPPPADLAAHVACIWNANVGDAGLPYTVQDARVSRA